MRKSKPKPRRAVIDADACPWIAGYARSYGIGFDRAVNDILRTGMAKLYREALESEMGPDILERFYLSMDQDLILDWLVKEATSGSDSGPESADPGMDMPRVAAQGIQRSRRSSRDRPCGSTMADEEETGS